MDILQDDVHALYDSDAAHILSMGSVKCLEAVDGPGYPHTVLIVEEEKLPLVNGCVHVLRLLHPLQII